MVIQGYKQPKKPKQPKGVPRASTRSQTQAGDHSVNPSLLPAEELRKLRAKKVKQSIPSTYYAPAPKFLTSGNIRPTTRR